MILYRPFDRSPRGILNSPYLPILNLSEELRLAIQRKYKYYIINKNTNIIDNAKNIYSNFLLPFSSTMAILQPCLNPGSIASTLRPVTGGTRSSRLKFCLNTSTDSR